MYEGIIAGYKYGAYDALIGPLGGRLQHVLPEILASQAGRIVNDQHRRPPHLAAEPRGCLSQGLQRVV